MAAKQKQSQAARRRGKSSRGGGLAWFFAGAIVGGLVTWTVIGRDPAAEQVRTMVGRTVGHPIVVGPGTSKQEPEFEFYQMLPMMEEVVPDEELGKPDPAPAESSAADAAAAADTAGATDAAAAADKEVPAPREDGKDAEGKDKAPLKPGHYVVQVASFRNVKDADGLKAKLILLGFEPVVQGVVISGNEKRYRVRLGPYSDRDALEAARVQLKANGHDEPLVLRVKKG